MERKAEIKARLQRHAEQAVKYFLRAEQATKGTDPDLRNYMYRKSQEKGALHMEIAYELSRVLGEPVWKVEDFITEELNKHDEEAEASRQEDAALDAMEAGISEAETDYEGVSE